MFNGGVKMNREFTFGKRIRDVIDGAQYTNNDPVGANSGNIPTIVVRDWDNVKATDKVLINNIANATDWDFEDVPS